MNSAEPSTPSPQATESILGNDRKTRVPKLPDEAHTIIETPTEKRYRLQDVARRIVGGRDERLQRCLRCALPGAASIEVRRDPERNTAHYRNLELCSRVWTCPVCSARITNERRQELSEALAAAKLAGYMPILVTYTLQHSWRDKLDDVLSGLLGALRGFKSGRGYQDIKSEYSILGGIRSLEPTYGENGWHPHIHELLILEKPISDQQVTGLRKWYADRWIATLNKLGFDASFEHGIDIRTADSDIADYIAKYGHEPQEMTWQVEHEITKGPAKMARRDGLTPFQLLDCYDVGDDRAGRLFLEYATVMQKHPQLRWSAGLRDLLKLPPELLDEQLPLIDETPEVLTVIEFTPAQWSRVCWAGVRGDVLTHAGAGDFTGLRALFRRYGITATICDPDAPPGPAPAAPAPALAQLKLLDAPVKFEYQ